MYMCVCLSDNKITFKKITADQITPLVFQLLLPVLFYLIVISYEIPEESHQ